MDVGDFFYGCGFEVVTGDGVVVILYFIFLCGAELEREIK